MADNTRVQARFDEYLAGRIDEADLLVEAIREDNAERRLKVERITAHMRLLLLVSDAYKATLGESCPGWAPGPVADAREGDARGSDE